MASVLINNWMNDIQKKIDFWYNNYTSTAGVFVISPLPLSPVVHLDILNHNVTSACPSTNYPAISFAHFPEPYYGNPDDQIEKLAVVLFYNPGPSGDDQLLSNNGPGTFHENYKKAGYNYFELSSNLQFCNGTINRFWNPKNNQLINLFEDLSFEKPELNPLFLDLVPWHSDKFNGVEISRYNLPNCIDELKRNVFLPAILNAQNSAISHYLNKVTNSTSKIVMFAVGAKYSRDGYLSSIGFNDITDTIPQLAPHTIIQGNDIRINGSSSKMKIWKLEGGTLTIEGLNISDLQNKEIFIINMWTANVGMDIPRGSSETLKHVLMNL